MAIRKIRYEGDEILRKISKKVENFNENIIELLKDMGETMHKEGGLGLAAPQVGILKRAIVIDIGEGIIELINPEVIEEKGEQLVIEGCLSVPSVDGRPIQAELKRPKWVMVKAQDIEGKEITIEGSNLLAQVLSHEIDHLNGILFIDKIIRYLDCED